LWLASLLALVVAGIALSPFWAPSVAPLLPWSGSSEISAQDSAALTARLADVEKGAASVNPGIDAIRSVESALEHRVSQIESSINARLTEIEQHRSPAGSDVDATAAAESALTRRVEDLEAARSTERQSEATVAATKTALQQLEQRVGSIEAQSSSRATSEAAELQKMRQEVSRLGNVNAELANRLPAIERQAQSQSGAARTDAVLALALLQMREAVDQARPFVAEYGTFKSLAGASDLAAAAEPLAEAARNGVPGRTVLSKRLAELAAHITAAPALPAETDWGAQALTRLRSLVTIRRIDSAPQTGPEAVVVAAQAALARGDLAEAVATLETLSGANAEAARPWLQMARQRLAVEAVLRHLQELLSARLSGTPAAPGEAPAAPPASPAAREPS
jgi:hypothetical protein